MTPEEIQVAAHAASVIGPAFWLWGIAIVFQTAVFAALGAWAVSRFINKLIEKIRTEIDEAVKALTEADSKVEKVTGDSINAMRQHVSNHERECEKRFHALEKKVLEDKAHYLEFFVRRGSFDRVTQKIENDVDALAQEMRGGFEKISGKIDEIRDRKAA